jgi:hypothetical protein
MKHKSLQKLVEHVQRMNERKMHGNCIKIHIWCTNKWRRPRLNQPTYQA